MRRAKRQRGPCCYAGGVPGPQGAAACSLLEAQAKVFSLLLLRRNLPLRRDGLLLLLFWLHFRCMGARVRNIMPQRPVAPVQVPFPDYDEGAPGPSQLGTGERWILQLERDDSSKTPQGPDLRLGSRVSRNCGVRQSHSSICRELPSLRAQ